jgi:delta 1-pyrroline-5-carboxylate dehydrogenase
MFSRAALASKSGQNNRKRGTDACRAACLHHADLEKGVTKVSGIKEYRYFAGGRPEAKLAVDAAAKAFPAWSQTTPAERARLFFKAAEIVKRRAVLADNALKLFPRLVARAPKEQESARSPRTQSTP